MIGLGVGIAIAVILFIIVICLFAWYRIVDPSEAHLVVTPGGKFVVSADDNVATNKTKTYFAIPSWLPFFGRAIRIMDVTIKELVVNQETYEKNQARYNVKSSCKYRITDVQTSAETFVSDAELQEQLKEVIRASVRAVTVKYDVVDARAFKQKMGDEIQKEMQDDLDKWGLTLINFQLVDFQDTDDSSIISDISKRREVEIQSTTREQNAEKLKQARMKEAEAEEKAKEREIAKEKVIGEREENKKQKIAEQQKIAEEKRYEVVRVQTVKQAEITKAEAEVKAKQDKEVAIIKASQDKEAEKIMKEQKLLEGQGDRQRAEEQAKGEAAPIREMGNAEADIIKAKGLAEAIAKDKLQEALNKFTPEAINALVAEIVVDKDKAIGVETAKALTEADLKVFAGGGKAGQDGFDLGKLISATTVANPTAADALGNRVARPNDMGLSALGLISIAEQAQEKAKAKKSEVAKKKATPKSEPKANPKANKKA